MTPAKRALLATTVVWGAFPLVNAAADGQKSPLMFMVAWCLGGTIGCLWYCFSGDSKRVRLDEIRHFVIPSRKSFFSDLSRSRVKWNWQVYLGMSRSFGVGFFSWSTIFLPSAIAAVLVESWPIFYVVLLGVLFRETGQHAVGLKTLGMFALVFVGVVLVVLSGSHADNDMGITAWDVLIGSVLLFATIGCIIQEAGFIKWAGKWQDHRGADLATPPDKLESRLTHLTLFCQTCSMAVGGVIAAIALPFTSARIGLAEFLLACGCGAAVELVGNVASIKGTLRAAQQPNLQAIRYITPVFAIAYLWAASYTEDVTLGYLLTGLAIIIAGNVLASWAQPEVKQETEETVVHETAE